MSNEYNVGDSVWWAKADTEQVSRNGRTCLPHCWRWHRGDPEPTVQCDWCDARLPYGNTEAKIAHNKYHLRQPESITR